MDVRRTLFEGVPGPFHLMVPSAAGRRPSPALVYHVRDSPEAHAASISAGGLRVTDPCFTLLTLATELTPVRLAMAIYEMAGRFAAYRPSPRLAERIDVMRRDGGLSELMPWKPAFDVNGEHTGLWRRPPLVTLDELIRFACRTRGMRGRVGLSRSLRMVFGVAASPLEARAALLFGLPASRGGEGLGAPELNVRINLSNQARSIANREYCVADLLYRGSGVIVDIECMGVAYHLDETRRRLDANRTTALRCMGVEVIQITHADLANPVRLHEISGMVARLIGKRRREKTGEYLKREEALRSEVFCNWEDICR